MWLGSQLFALRFLPATTDPTNETQDKKNNDHDDEGSDDPVHQCLMLKRRDHRTPCSHGGNATMPPMSWMMTHKTTSTSNKTNNTLMIRTNGSGNGIRGNSCVT